MRHPNSMIPEGQKLIPQDVLNKARTARHLLPEPGPQVVEDLLDHIAALQAQVQDLTKEAASWKKRAAQHGCDTENGDIDCG